VGNGGDDEQVFSQSVYAGAPQRPQARQAGDPHERIGELERELDSWKERCLRALADADNFRKRLSREKQDAIHFANERLLRELLPVLDNLEKAAESAADASGAEGVILQGVRMVLAQFHQSLRRFGAEAFDALGEAFDPERHRAIQQRETEEFRPGTVIEQAARGYTLHGRLLRPAIVTVATAPGPTSEVQQIARSQDLQQAIEETLRQLQGFGPGRAGATPPQEADLSDVAQTPDLRDAITEALRRIQSDPAQGPPGGRGPTAAPRPRAVPPSAAEEVGFSETDPFAAEDTTPGLERPAAIPEAVLDDETSLDRGRGGQGD
jgi:molecular chaperone GrpE